MTVVVVTTIHCDREGCAEWVYAADAGGNSNLEWRQAMGWTMTRARGRPRIDYCPAHSTVPAPQPS